MTRLLLALTLLAACGPKSRSSEPLGQPVPGAVTERIEAGLVVQEVDLNGDGRPGRSVVLKRTTKRRSVPFARWVIAHELAHAYLRHGGRFPNEDPEHAADSLAAEWGFPKPELR